MNPFSKFETSDNKPTTFPKFETSDNKPTTLAELFARIETSSTDEDIIECGVIHCGAEIFVYPATIDIDDISFFDLYEHKIAHTYAKYAIRGIHRYKNMRFNTVTKDITFADGRKLDI